MEKLKKRQKHNYTSELELKSLLIRVKNNKNNVGTEKYNSTINRYIKTHTKINNKKYTNPQKRNITKAKLKKRIIELSEITKTDKVTYERFGTVILLMIKNILKKPQFSGYTYRDDFYSDAVHKILKYLHNFDHTMISERTETLVNSFAYISQIIHNSILFIINTKKKENEHLKKQIGFESLNHNLKLSDTNCNASTYEYEKYIIKEIIELKTINTSLYDEIKKITDNIDLEKLYQINVIYPKDYVISFEEYNKLKNILKLKINIIRER